MKQKLVLCGLVMSFILGGVGSVMPVEHEQRLEQQVALRALAKYSTVFRLIPSRVSQMLQVVNAYPASDVVRRTDLLQLVIQRMHDMYRITQLIQNRVAEIGGVQAQPLIDALKKYQVTLISTLSVFDSEFVRSLKRSRSTSESSAKSGSDSAYNAAKLVLRHNQMDTLIESMAGGGQGVGGEVANGSIKNEIRQLRDQVSLLSSQLQSKALLDGDRGGDEKVFSHQVSELAQQNAEALRAAQTSLSGISNLVEPSVKKNKRSLRKSSRPVAGVPTQPVTLQEYVRAGYAAVSVRVMAAGNWVYSSVPYVDQAWDGITALFSRVFTDTHKAISHVGTRMKEVKEIAPEGVSVATGGLWSFGEWIVESWVRILNYILELTVPVRTYVATQWCAFMQKCSGLDGAMRAFVCRLIDQVVAYRVWLWDGSMVYDEDKEEEVMQPGMIKVWTARVVTTTKEHVGAIKNRFFPATKEETKKHAKHKNATAEQTILEKAFTAGKVYGSLVLEKVCQIYTLIMEYVVAAKNRYFPPMVVVKQ